MDDLISRQAAIDGLAEEFYHSEEDYRTAVKVIGNLPSAQPEVLAHGEGELSAQPEQQWIPCSERPPKEEDGRVLITLDGEVTTAIYSEFSKTWYIGDMCGVSNRVPTAWMPRPEPYKGEVKHG